MSKIQALLWGLAIGFIVLIIGVKTYDRHLSHSAAAQLSQIKSQYAKAGVEVDTLQTVDPKAVECQLRVFKLATTLMEMVYNLEEFEATLYQSLQFHTIFGGITRLKKEEALFLNLSAQQARLHSTNLEAIKLDMIARDPCSSRDLRTELRSKLMSEAPADFGGGFFVKATDYA